MSQWLVVNEVRYDLQDAVQHASIRSLVDLQKAAGISVNTIAETLVGMGEMQSPEELFESVERLNVFAALVFLCRRKAGEQVSFDDASEVSMADVALDFDDDEDEAEDDPKGQSTPEEPGSE
jgi:hypothetical protein